MTDMQPPISDPEEVVVQYANAVYRLGYAMVRSRSDADDVFQEAFLRYFRAAPPFQSREHQKAWLIRVTVNCGKKLLTSTWRRRRASLSDSIPLPVPEETGLYEAMEELSPLYRGVLHLYYQEGYQAEEIARMLGRRPGTVRAQLTRARTQLKTLLKEECRDA